MIVNRGEKIHIMVRRYFDTDLRRHFIGEVIEMSGSIARLEGYVFVLDTTTNQYIRRPERRTRIIGLGDSGNIVNVLPENTKLEKTQYVLCPDKRLIVTDGETFQLDINEFGINH
jgi:tRNA A58 N-methylase Trm61